MGRNVPGIVEGLNMYDVTASIVAYENDPGVIERAIDSFLSCKMRVRLIVVDNSRGDSLRRICSRPGIEYVFNKANIGFGAAHNIAISMSAGKSEFFLAMNPDIYFAPGTVESVVKFMRDDLSVGMVLPKVLYPDGALQYLCRLLPAPLDILSRKMDLLPFLVFLKPLRDRYELRCADHSRQFDAPYLSGCFMFMRSDVLLRVGGFDERFFLYFEDVDLSRRINSSSRTVYYPGAVVYHGYRRASNSDPTDMRRLLISGIKYFNKWGWFMDTRRSEVNEKTLKNIVMLNER